MNRAKDQHRENRASSSQKKSRSATDAELLRGLYGAQRKGEFSRWIQDQEKACRELNSNDRSFRVR